VRRHAVMKCAAGVGLHVNGCWRGVLVYLAVTWLCLAWQNHRRHHRRRRRRRRSRRHRPCSRPPPRTSSPTSTTDARRLLDRTVPTDLQNGHPP